jgi:hypothetical protein
MDGALLLARRDLGRIGQGATGDVLNGKSKRLLALYPTEAETIAAIKEAVLLEAKWQGSR